ncbi:MAG: hypothetical protein AAGG48_29655 [Planctomycetota bacterium]
MPGDGTCAWLFYEGHWHLYTSCPSGRCLKEPPTQSGNEWDFSDGQCSGGDTGGQAAEADPPLEFFCEPGDSRTDEKPVLLLRHVPSVIEKQWLRLKWGGARGGAQAPYIDGGGDASVNTIADSVEEALANSVYYQDGRSVNNPANCMYLVTVDQDVRQPKVRKLRRRVGFGRSPVR